MIRAGLAALVLLAAARAPAAPTCALSDADGARLTGDGVELAWAVDGGGAPPVGRPFALRVRACPAGAELQRVDATMPAHRHGMNYRPRVEATGPGQWRVEGLLWHMAGRWEWQFDLRHDGRVQTLRQPVEAP